MKRFLLLLAILFSAVCTPAQNWTQIDTDIPDFDMYIDMDSVKYIEPHVAVYSILYGKIGSPDKVAYLKSDFRKQYIGVITSQDYDEKLYRPEVVLKNPHVFMKPLKQDSFLKFPHRVLLLNFNRELDGMFDNVVDIDNANDLDKEYIIQASKVLAKNWNPPMSAYNTETEAIIKIGADGSLQNAIISQPGADDTTDRSILAAIEKTVPFERFSSKNEMKIRFKFKFNNFQKYVR